MVNGLTTLMRVSALMSFLTINLCTVSEGKPQLRLVNVVQRHGHRTPSPEWTYPNDPYMNLTYFPIGRVGLTTVGKQRVYESGKLLRSRYNDFLGPFYTPTIVDARSTDQDRTKMAIQLLLAGIFPPQSIQRWSKELLWQPIPASYQSNDTDNVLYSDLACQEYHTEYIRVRDSQEWQRQISGLRGLMKSLEAFTGRSYNDTSPMFTLYLLLESQEASGLRLPSWAYQIYPRGELWDAIQLNFKLRNYNDKLKRLGGGMLLRKMIDDTQSLKNGTLPADRKLYLYEAHTTVIVGLQKVLGVWKPHMPAYSSAVIIENWEDGAGKFYVKVLYYTGTSSKLVTQKVPGCSVLCPLEKFMKLMKRVTASEADLQCP